MSDTKPTDPLRIAFDTGYRAALDDVRAAIEAEMTKCGHIYRHAILARLDKLEKEGGK